MSKYLFIASYTVEGAQGLMKEGASGRRAAIESMVSGLGGSVELHVLRFWQ